MPTLGRPTRDRPAGRSQKVMATALAALALLIVVGCAKTHSGMNGAGTAVPVASLNCHALPNAAPDRLPDHEWVAVALCPLTIVPVTPGNTAAPSLAQQRPQLVRGDLRPLVTALRQPDASPAALPCAEEQVDIQPFWLVDRDQKAYRPQVPKGACGQPSPAVTAALHRLH